MQFKGHEFNISYLCTVSQDINNMRDHNLWSLAQENNYEKPSG